MRLPIVGPYLQHEVTNGGDPICKMKVAMVLTLYGIMRLSMVMTLFVTRSCQQWNPICNMRLPMVGNLYAA